MRDPKDRYRPPVPRWLQIGWLAFMAIWVPTYWIHYGPSNFLWFCDTANFALTVAIVRGMPRLFSAQAVGVLIIQLLWCADLLGRLLFGVHLIGGTEYMFDPTWSPALRALSLFHLAVPVLLVWALLRFGYDRRAWRLEIWILWASLIPSFFVRPELNLNWAWKPFGWDPGVAPVLWVPLALVLYPAVILGVSHWVLRSLLPVHIAAES